MDSRDSRNVRRILHLLAADWNCPVWLAKWIIRKTINKSWKKAMSDPEIKARWEKYYPNGKPSPEEFILRLGHAHENGEEIPCLLSK